MLPEHLIQDINNPKNENVEQPYDSIYDMGNPYKLTEQECQIYALALAIVKREDPESERDIQRLESSSTYQDIKAAEMARDSQASSAKEWVHRLTRQDGGYIEQLKIHLDLDLNLFDSNCMVNKRDRVKILYFVYLLKQQYGLKALDLFDKPSMENIDATILNKDTFNGHILQYVKASLGKELSLKTKNEIICSLRRIAFEWDNLIRGIVFHIELLDWGENIVEKRIDSILLQSIPDIFPHTDGKSDYYHSPVATFYLKVLQHEYLSHIVDMIKLINAEQKSDLDMPPEYIAAIKSCERKIIAVNDVEKYVLDHATELASLVWHNLKPNKNHYRKIRNCAEKVQRWIRFCMEARPVADVQNSVTELLILSCLQVFLNDHNDNKNQFNNYAFPLYESYMKHMPTTQTVLKSDTHLSDAKQIFWIYKVLDQLYANAGMYQVRRRLLQYVQRCYSILEFILCCPNTDEMLDAHQRAIEHEESAYRQFVALDKQVKSILQFELYMADKGFTLIDEQKSIRYVFTCSDDTEYIFDSLTCQIEAALICRQPSLHFQVKAAANNKYRGIDISLVYNAGINIVDGDHAAIDFKLVFDYQQHTCTVSDFKMHDNTNI